MKITGIDHIAIMVADMDQANKLYGDLMGLEFSHYEEDHETWNSKYAFYRCGDAWLELICPLGPGPNQDFLNETGGGLHHIAYITDDINETIQVMQAELATQTENPLPGANGSRIFFLEKASAGNVETEFVELAK